MTVTGLANIKHWDNAKGTEVDGPFIAHVKRNTSRRTQPINVATLTSTYEPRDGWPAATDGPNAPTA